MDDLLSSLESWDAWMEASPDRPDRTKMLLVAGSGYRCLHEGSGERAHLEKSTQCLNDALLLALGACPGGTGEQLFRLGLGYRSRHEESKLVSDINTSVRLLCRAVESTQRNASERPDRLSELAYSYMLRHQATGAMSDFDDAARTFDNCLDATPADHPQRASYEYRASYLHQDRYMRTGDETAAKLAIHHNAKSLLAQSHDESSIRHYNRRHEAVLAMAGSTRDLSMTQRMLRLYSGLLELLPPEHPLVPEYLSACGWTHLIKFTIDGDISDLDLSMERFQQALESGPKNGLHRSIQLYRLGIGFGYKYDTSGDISSLDACIGFLEQGAAGLAPSNISCLTELSRRLIERYAISHNEADAAAAIQILENAVDATPTNNHETTLRLRFLALAYYHRWSGNNTPRTWTNTSTGLNRSIARSRQTIRRRLGQ